MTSVLSRYIELGIKFSIVDNKLKVLFPVNDIAPDIIEEIKRDKDIIKEALLGITAGDKQNSINKAEEKEYYELSSAQMRLYFLYNYDKTSLAYNVPKAVILEGEIDRNKLRTVFNDLITRHESLRTSFELINDEVFQKISEQINFEIEYFTLNQENPQSLIKQFIRPFDLSKAPLLRVGLIGISDTEHILMVDMHHIVSDGISQGILIKDFMSLYNNEKLPELLIQYKDYAEWQKCDEIQILSLKQKDFWLNEFSEEVTALELPIDFLRPLINSYEGATLEFQISKDETRDLKTIAKTEGTTMFMFLLSIFNILLGKLANKEDIVVGSPVAGRLHKDLQNVMGMFINTIPIRNYPKGELTFSEFLSDVKTKTLTCFDNQFYQYEELISALKIERNANRNPLFDVVFAYQNFEEHTLEIPGFRLKPYSNKIANSKFDITLTAFESGNNIKFIFEYSTNLFKKEAIERFIGYFRRIISTIIENPYQKISGIEIVSEEEKRMLLSGLNNAEVGYPKDKTVHDLFRAQAKRSTKNIAVRFENQLITYGDLDDQSNRLAALLRGNGVRPDDVVGLLTDRSIETVVGMLSIIKAGGAYLPIDVDYPEERKEFLVQDSGASILLTTQKWKGNLKSGVSTVYIEDSEKITNQKTVLENVNSPSDLCYVIYTSGTTGNPKGVMVEHKNVVGLLFNDLFQFDFGSEDVWTMFHSHCFDFSVWEIYGALLFGGRLIVIPKMEAMDPSVFLRTLKEQKVTVLNQTPSAFYNLLQEEEHSSEASLSLRYVIFGGESLSPAKLGGWRRRYPMVKLINMFGITETTVHVTYKEIGEYEISNNISSIGKPIPTLSVYILDKYQKLVPKGVVGELYVGGAGVARGYLGNKELTGARFIQNPYNPDEKLYRSGDLGRVLGSGDIEYLGRIDHQVQLRGFRVELREIETCLLGLDQIKECVVVANKNELDELYLSAYFILNESYLSYSVEGIKESLSRKLPSYMIPSYFIKLDKIPLTTNGKIDRKALPEPQILRLEGFAKPTTSTQKMLVEIWKESLKLEEVSINDQFFNIGGDSIKAIRLINAINKSFNIELRIADLYLNESIKKLSTIISDQKSNRNEDRKAIEKNIIELKTNILDRLEEKKLIEDIYPMSDIEIGMSYHSILDREGGTYHDQMVRQVIIPNFNPQYFEKALKLLSDKHSILRTTLHLDDFQEPVQFVHVKSAVDYQHKDLTGLSSNEQENFLLQELKNDKLKGFDIKKLPLWHTKSFSVGNDVIVVLFVCHHAILDGWSDSSLMTELNNVYLKLIENDSYKPKQLQCTYRDHVIDQILEKKNEETREYWIQELKDYNRLEFSKDLNIIEEKNIKEVHINEELASNIEKLANEYGTSLKNVYFAVYIDTIRRFSYKRDFVVGIVSNTRPVCSDGDKLLGCFLNTVPVNICLQPDITIGNYLTYIFNKLKVLTLYDRLSLSEIQKLVGEDSSDRNPFFDTLFNFVDFHVFEDIEVTKAVDYLGIKGNVRINTLFDFSIDKSFYETSLLLLYTNRIITDSRADEICNCFITTLKRFSSNPDEQLGIDKAFSEKEKHELLYSFNNTENHNCSNQVSKLLNRVFREYPNKKAIIIPVDLEDISFKYGVSVSKEEIIYDDYTYQYIDQKSNSLARYLEKKGVRKNSIIGILLEPSIEMIISIVASLKSGVGYMPISSEFPKDRISYMLKDSDAKILLSDGLFDQDKAFNGEVVNVDEDFIYDESDEPLENEVGGDDAAYIIYTSGTTGKPKGVIVNQGNIANYINWFTAKMSITSNDKGILTSSFAFDLGYSSLYTSILNGAELHLPSKDLYLSSVKLIRYIDSNGISYLKLTPSHFNAIINSNELKSDNVNNLRLILLGGEPINTIDLKKLFSIKKEITIVNHYGPTEATIGCIAKIVKSEMIDEYSIQPVIGSPIHNAKAIILDNEGGILPKGVLGELCISGKGIALGYLNKPELTHSKFIRLDQVEGKVYRTGDKAKWLFNGDIDFIGRVDNQVKIRGYRVELGEVESSLKKSSLVRDVIVVAKQNSNNDKYICAYIIKEKEDAENYCVCSVNSDSKIDFSELPAILSKKSAERAEEDFIVASNTSLNYHDVNIKVDSIATSINSHFDNKYSLGTNERERYKRQILLDSWGLDSQEKLKSTTVFVAGAGGGASPTLMQLALAGFGKIIVCDFDEVELSNLNRQFMHDESRIGMNKALSAKETLLRVNPNIEVVPIVEKLTRDNVSRLVGDSAIIFDMFDGVQDKFILSECAVEKGIPHIISAMTDINGYSAIFHSPMTPCFHCVFDRNKLNTLVEGMKSVDESYKKNPLAVVSSSLFVSTGFAVTETLKIILGLGVPAYNKFFYYNSKGTDRISEMPNYRSMTYSFSDLFREVSKEQGFDWEIGWRGKYLEELTVKKDTNCPVCGSSALRNKRENTNSRQDLANVSKKVITNGENENNCVSICLNDEVAMSLSIFAVIRAGKSFCILDPNKMDSDLKNIVTTSGTRIIITDNNNFNRTEKFRNDVNRNINILNIDLIDNKQSSSNQPNNNNLYYFYNDNNNEVKSIQLAQLANWFVTEQDSSSKTDLVILKKIYDALLSNKKLVFKRKLFNGDDISTILNQELLEHLPEYMLPAMYIEINSIPLTPNGKVNIKALPEPLQVLDDEIEKPQDEKEEIILQVWQEVLGRDKISITDNFFRIGGDSIKAIQISARLNKVGYKLEMGDLLRLATIKGVATVIKKSTLAIDQSDVTGDVLLTPIQKEFFKNNVDLYHRNMAVMFHSSNSLREEEVLVVFNKIVQHHDVLRSTFTNVDGNIIQKIVSVNGNVPLSTYDLRGDKNAVNKIEELATQIHASFDLSIAPLIKLGLFKLDDSDRLLISIHHLVMDGISWRILFEDMSILMNQYKKNEKLTLPFKTHSFKQWSDKLHEYSKSDVLNREREYWEKLDLSAVKPIPEDYKGDDRVKNSGSIIYEFDADITSNILTKANDAFGTEVNDLLLTSLCLSIHRLYGYDNVLISLEGHGRENINANVDISRTIGWFTTVFPVSLNMEYADDLRKQIIVNKDSIHRIPNKGIGYGLLKMINEKPSNVYDLNPQISFNYLGQFDEDINLINEFTLAKESMGVTYSPEGLLASDISFSGMVRNKKLEITLLYNKSKYNKERMEMLLNQFIQELLNVVQFCLSKEDQEVTSSDFDYKDLSVEDLESIFD